MASAPSTPKAGWEVKTLGEVCRIKPPKAEAKEKLRQEEMVSFVPMNDLKEVQKDFSVEQEKQLGKAYGGYTYFAENDVLLAKITPCFENGKLGIARGLTNGIGFGSSEFVVFRSSDNITPEYLFYFLSRDTFRIEGKEVMTGAVGHKRVPKEFIENYRMPLPPLPEQERIVGILDEAFERIAAATAQAEKNLHNARELFQSVLQSTFSQKGDDWVETTLGENAIFRNGMNFSKNSRGQTVKVVGVGDFKQRFWVPTESLDDKTIDGELDKQDQLLEDDFLFVRSNGNKELIGRCMLTGSISAPITHSGFTIRMRLVEPDFFPLFLCWYLKSDQARNSLIGSGSGAQISNLNQGTLSALTVPKPSLPTQQAIVEKLDALSEETKALEAIYERKQSALAELKQSLLQKAFAGEL